VDEDFVNITWKVSFSGITPNNLLLDDRMGFVASAYMDKNSKLDTDEEKEKTQGRLEFISMRRLIQGLLFFDYSKR
jgi:hypothetical protein